MALTKCKECKKEVSTSAKTCPHCGVKDPGFGAKQKLSGCLVLIIITVTVMYFIGNDDEKTTEVPKTCSNTDTQCNFDKYMVDAVTKCKPLIEKSAKFEFEWTDGLLDPMFSHGSIDSQKNELTFIGDKVKFTNGFNAKTTMTYSCTLNLKSKEVTHFKIQQGKL
ncbi:hypothetical protein I9Y19_003266 [Citrobacter freundii]|uniref:Zinc ribbon domain-containing protein n=2 Tax=Enterobacteriaceae TaxID=543 RepID=A0ABY7KVM5_CITFR|nr:hypothetical protein [Citrobacter freundii]EIJ9084080.1 hypothetical protein [Citrobacter freundii]EJH9545042.1 hypothetical protein [Citrobacter freundii]EJO6484713.1 hypothetical protein [Citrobacter freundii]EKW5683570.1 hypothetical protein [Citrobacter freundii]EKX9688879.1 hypothetical protein [Citrobacter freundii]